MEEDSFTSSCIFIYEYGVNFQAANSLGLHFGIAVKADNGLYWDAGGSDGKFIVASSDVPVYFSI